MAPLTRPSYATESTKELTKGCRDAEDSKNWLQVEKEKITFIFEVHSKTK